MVKLSVFRNTALWIITLLVAGCSGMAPYDPPAYDEPPPTRGLFSGADGEFVIYQGSFETKPDGEANEDKEQKRP